MQKIKQQISGFAGRVKPACKSKRGESYVDSGVKILIAVVIGALLLSLLYALFNDTVMPTVTSKVESLFAYSEASGGGSVPEAGPVLYPIVSSQTNANQSGVFAVADMSLQDLVRCTMDGSPIASPEIMVYEVMSGNIRVDFNEEYAASLTSGNHIFRFEAEDGYAEVIIRK